MPKQLEIEVKESLNYLYRLQKQHANRTLFNRIQMLILLKTKKIKYITELSDGLPYSLRSIKGWVKTYKAKGLEALLADGRGANRPAAICGQAYTKLKELLENPNNQITSYGELLAFVQQLGVVIKYKAFYKFVNHHFDVKLKVGRKSNIKKDAAAVAVFKNNR